MLRSSQDTSKVVNAGVFSNELAPLIDADVDIMPQRNHYWNAGQSLNFHSANITVVVNGEWRMIDASLASPTHPSRPPPTTKSFDAYYFLTRPSEFLYTHIPLGDSQHHHVLAQEIIPPAIQLALPYACPAYFQHDLALQSDFDVSQTRLDGLQVACIDVEVPEDVECVAEVESQIFSRDPEGDLFESGEVIKEPALAQPVWLDGGQRRFYRIKAFLNGEGSRGTLKIFAGKKGLMVLSSFSVADGYFRRLHLITHID
jgi:transglutaminase/protease-like cytokinesis protein 3